MADPDRWLPVTPVPMRYVGSQRLTSSGALTIPENAHAVLLIADAGGARWKFTTGTVGAADSAGTSDPLIPTTGITLPLVASDGSRITRASVYIPGSPSAAEVQAVYLGV